MKVGNNDLFESCRILRQDAEISHRPMSKDLTRHYEVSLWPTKADFLRLHLVSLVFLCSICISPLAAQNVPPDPIEFTNVAAAAGIKFKHFKGNKGISINREEFGPGVCVADFDGDGWQDIYFVNGRDLYDRGIAVENALYHNNHDGTFTDVTKKAGVPRNRLRSGLRMGRLR